MPALKDEIEAALTGKPGTDAVVITGIGLMTSVGHGVPQAVTSMAPAPRGWRSSGYEPIGAIPKSSSPSRSPRPRSPA